MKVCATCDKPLERRNKSGYCSPHANAARAGDPAWRAKLSASIRRKIAHDPVFAEQKRAVARRLSDNPDIVARRTVGFDQSIRDRGLKAAHSPKARAKAGRTLTETRLAWCPVHLRAEYLRMVRGHVCPAAEARRMIEDQHEMEMARWRRSIGVVPQAEASPFNPVTALVLPDEELPRAIAAVAHFTGVDEFAITGRGRTAEHARARHILMYVLGAMGRSLSSVGRALNMDHSSVGYGDRLVERLIETDTTVATLVASILEAVGRSKAA